jgi:hypothetical protein
VADGGYGVFAVEKITAGETIGTIPSRLVVSPRVTDASPIVAGVGDDA